MNCLKIVSSSVTVCVFQTWRLSARLSEFVSKNLMLCGMAVCFYTPFCKTAARQNWYVFRNRRQRMERLSGEHLKMSQIETEHETSDCVMHEILALRHGIVAISPPHPVGCRLGNAALLVSVGNFFTNEQAGTCYSVQDSNCLGRYAV